MAGQKAVYEVFTRFRIDAKGWDKSLNRLSRSLNRAGKNMQRTGQNLTRSLTLPLALAGAASVKFAIDLEQSFSKIQNLVGIGTESLKEFTKQVRRISDETGKSQKELAEALFFVTSAGLRGKKAIEALEASAKAGAIGLGDIAEIADATTSIINAYGDEMYSAGRATDILLNIAKQGKVEASSLARNLGKVIPTAATLGVSMEEVGANIAVFTKIGASAEEATTGLANVMKILLKTTPQTRKAMKDLGIPIDRLRATQKKDGLAAVLREIIDATKGNFDALTAVIPGFKGLQGVLATMGVQGDTYTEVLKAMKTETGLVDQGFANLSKTAGFKFTQALTKLQNVAIELGNILIPILIKVVAKIVDIINVFKGFSDETKRTIVQIALVVAAIGPALFVFGKIVIILGTIVKLFKALNLAMLVTAAKVLAIVAAVAALVAIGVALSRNWENVQKFFVNVWDRIKLAFFKSIEQIKALWAGFLTFLGLDASGTLKSIIDAREQIDELQKNVSNQLPLSIQALELFGSTWEELKGVIDDVKNSATGAFNALRGGGPSTAIVDIPQTIQGKKQDRVTGVNQGPSMFAGIGESLDFITPKFDYLNTIIAQTNINIDKAIEKKKQWAETITGVLTSAFDGLGNAIIAGFEKGESGLKAFGQFFIDFAKGLLAKMISLIVTAVILSAVLSTLGFGIGAGGGIEKGLSLGKSIGNVLKGGLPGLAIGTDFVNSDGLAMLHKGEQVVPANVAGGGFSGGNRELIAVVKGSDLNFVLSEYDRKRGNTA